MIPFFVFGQYFMFYYSITPYVVANCVLAISLPRCSPLSAPQINIVTGRLTVATTLEHLSTSAHFMSL